MWVCRDKKPWSSANKKRYYSIYSDEPSKETHFIEGQWYDEEASIEPYKAKRLFGFTLKPGEGPVEVEVKRK